MDGFANVSPGAPWSPEPAERYNAVNDLLLRADTLGGAGGSRNLALRGAATITAVYTGGSSLPAYSLLNISGAAILATSGGSVTINPNDPVETLFVATGAADAASVVFGVAQSPASSGGTVAVTLTGLTPVRVVSGGICSGGESLVPVSGGAAALGGGNITALGGTVELASGGGYLAPVFLGGRGLTLAAVTTMPTSGGGVGAVKPVAIGSGGAIALTSGGEIPVVFPYLDGYN